MVAIVNGTLSMNSLSFHFSLQDIWEKSRSDAEKKRKTLVIIAPELAQFQQTAKDLDQMLDAMETNIRVANINEEIHKVSIYMLIPLTG